jgi:hypothetical protein
MGRRRAYSLVRDLSCARLLFQRGLAQGIAVPGERTGAAAQRATAVLSETASLPTAISG